MITFYNKSQKPQLTLVSSHQTMPVTPLVQMIKGYIIRNVANPMKVQIPLKPAK
jgi:hypothetical protein